jgi:DNA-binding CsgD family transcriptional regulator
VERWRIEATRALTAVPAMLAAEEGRGLALEAAMAAALAAPASRDRRPDRVAWARDGLTAREVEVLALVGAGRSDAEISQTLFISPKTASVHVANIKGKLGVASRVEVALHARDLGLRPDSSDPNAP